MAAQGSLILRSLGTVFGDILKKDIEGDLTEDKKKETEVKLKKTKSNKKDDKKVEKTTLDHDLKRVIREEESSLITYGNPSVFSVFSRIRHFVLQNQLCETFNSRLSQDNQDEDELEDEAATEESGKKAEMKRMPVVVGLGVKGVFIIISEIWRTQPELCLRALREFGNILQGQSPDGLKNEPKETTDALFELLMHMVTEPSSSDSQLALDLSSVASACLLSLVVALGDTGKMLSAVSAMLTSPTSLSEGNVQIPEIFYALQSSVQAVLLGSVVDIDWMKQGVPSASLVENWPLPLPVGCGINDKSPVSVAGDGRYLYFHGPFGLLKVGSGYANTKKGFVYKSAREFNPDKAGWLGYCSSKLYFFPLDVGEDTITAINTDTLTPEETLELEAEAVGSQCLFTDGEFLGQIKAKKDGGFVVRKFTTLCSPLPIVEEKALELSQKSVLVMGRAKFDCQGDIHTTYQDSSEQVLQVMAGRTFAAIRTASGKLLYTGSGSVFGLTAKDLPKGEWKELEFPDKNVKVEHCSCDNAGTFCLVVSDKGVVYFGGLSKKGESGESAAGRQQPKPIKLKRMAKMKDHQAITTACGAHGTALISNEGKLFMFGNLEDDVTDKSTGVVTALLGVPASQVAMGRSHTCVLTQHGMVYTFGSNMYGQCGRNFEPPKEDGAGGVLVEGAEEEESSSDEEDDTRCAANEHKWHISVCMVCKYCGYCTGYGPGCCNEGSPGRVPGSECGCGSGEAGCQECGACKVCAGESDNWGGGGGLFDDLPKEVQQIRKRAGFKRGKKGKEKKDKTEKDGEKAMIQGLQLLFGGENDKAAEGEGTSIGEGSVEAKDKDPTKKPAPVPLPEDAIVMQIDCGTFHTALLLHSGEVYMFGNGNHGQLGQGNNKVCGELVKVPLPETAVQVACGDNHTVILLSSGQVVTFGKHQEGQLGRCKEGEDDEDSWHMVPRPITGLNVGRKAKWVGARGNQTFIVADELLVPDGTLSQYRAFANTHVIGLVPPKVTAAESHTSTVLVDREQLKAKRMDDDSQQILVGCGVCIDPEYNILWTYSPDGNKVASFNPVTSNIQDSVGTILSSTICLPRSKNAQTSRSHLALNLLSCLSTLATQPTLTSEVVAGGINRKYDKDEFQAVLRFNAHGGGWGYSNSSVEAIRFSPDTDILLGGYGLYGGRGNYNADIKVWDLGETSGESETEGTLLASHSETGYTCEKQQTCRVLFDKCVLLTADHWYVAHASVSSPSGASSDAGSSGQNTVTGQDKVVFKFKSSKRSNNGTDVGSGQIPQILYRIPEPEKDEGVQIQLLGKAFSSSVSADGLNAVLRLLDWSWNRLYKLTPDTPTSDGDYLTFIAKSALGLLKTYIQQSFPEKGRPSKPDLDCSELAAAVFEARTLLHLILSSRRPHIPSSEGCVSPLETVIDACYEAFRTCFHAFYPTTPLKWFALCQQLQIVDPSDVVSGIPMETLLSAILEALAQPTVSYIGLSYSTTMEINTAVYNSEPSMRFPVLSEYIQMKTLEENAGGQLLGFNAVATKLLGIVTAPIHSALATRQTEVSPVVSKAGELLLSRINELSLCVSYPESAGMLGLPVLQPEKRETVIESAPRFTTKECGHPSLPTTDVAFSVDNPIHLHGFTVYGSSSGSYKYKMSLLSQQEGEKPQASQEGVFGSGDCSGEHNFVKLLFKEPVKVEAGVVYTARVELQGDSFNVGVEGKVSLSGPGGVVFTLHHTGTEESNPETGPIANFLYSTLAMSGPQNVVQLSVHLASTLLDVTVGFLERVLGGDLSQDVFEILGSSFLFSTLLPTTLAQLGPIACRQPKYAVEVLDLVKRTLSVVSVAAQSAASACSSEPTPSTPAAYSDTKLMHYATVETEHPYKHSCVKHFKVKFNESVQWMTMEFDPRTGFAQAEDKIGELLVPRKAADLTPPVKPKQANAPPVVSQCLMGVGFDTVYEDWERYTLEYPPGLVMLPGNEVHIVVQTDTEYEKKDSNNHFGLKCQVVGYEWSSKTSDCLLLLEKELVSLGAMCATSLIKDNTVLPFADELTVSGNQDDTDKADMRIVQASSQEVLSKHSQVLSRGLMVDIPSIHQILIGEIPVIKNSSEQIFLADFIDSKSGTAGGRLARWLQPDRAVDPEASELELPSEPIKAGLSSEFLVHTKDQDGKPVFVNGMKVEVKAIWLGKNKGQNDVPSARDKMVDKVMGVRKPTFKRSYNPTRLNSNNVYHCVSMMMPFSNYSFEELRLFAPKVEKSTETMPLESRDNGTYVAKWVPSVRGNYLVQVFIDGRSTGQELPIEVIEPELPAEEEEEESVPQQDEMMEEQQEPAPEPTPLPKMKLFSGKAAPGLRIREQPSYMASPLGVIKPGEKFTYLEEVTNEAGTWVKLTVEAIKQLGCKENCSEAYALAFSKERGKEFLEEVEPPPELLEKLKTQFSSAPESTPKKPVSRKRQGGPGSYHVVQCGTAGHNVRSKPGMRGTSVGRLAKGNKIDALEEVENDDGIWLKLSNDNIKKYCESDTEAWTLAVGPSGRIFLTLEGDDSYQNQVIDTKAPPPKPNLFPTAAQVFGTSQQSVFGTPIAPPPPPVFNFGGGKPFKLLFGSEQPPLVKSQDLFKFGRSEKTKSKAPTEEDKKDSPKEKPAFSIGSGKGAAQRSARVVRRGRRRSPRSRSPSPSGEATKEEEKDSTTEEKDDSKSLATDQDDQDDVPKPVVIVKQALSPAVAECQRAVFAAFLWQEGLVHDAMASASFLKFQPDMSKEMGEDQKVKEQAKSQPTLKKESISSDTTVEDKESGDAVDKEAAKEAAVPSEEASPAIVIDKEATKTPLLPPTLNHLVTFWDEISCKVIDNSNAAFSAPKVPSLAQELVKRYEAEKMEIEKRKKEKDKKVSFGAGGGAGTVCEMCNQTFPDPITYHMKEAHPGCGKPASGWGYNSKGTFCSGWAGNCGDGGRGGSTWYLMCKTCHGRNLALKDEAKKKAVKSVPLPKMKTRKPGKPRSLPTVTAIQGMIQNAKFLLEVACTCDSTPTTPLTIKPPAIGELKTPGVERQLSSPHEEKSRLPRADSTQSETAAIQRPSFLRSVSVATGRDRPSPDGVTSPQKLPKSSFESSLMAKPSKNLRKLMYSRSRQGPMSKETGYSRVMSFLLLYHDLDGLRASMKQSMRVAGIRTFALEFVEWLLSKVNEPTIVHDVLWQFNSTLRDHPVQQMAAKLKEAKDEKAQKNDKSVESDDLFLGRHPLTGLDGAGIMLQMLRKQFHLFLQTTSNLMPELPVGSAVQQAAMQCYCLQFQPQDHSFLLQSDVFSNITKALSLGEDPQETSAVGEKRSIWDKDVEVKLMENILSKGRLKVSSNEAMSNSLTDGTTETFWESRDEPRAQPRKLTVTFDKEMPVFAVAVHIDNQKDAGQRVETVALLVGKDEDSLRGVDKAKFSMMHSGWKILFAPGDTLYGAVRLELKGMSNNVRVRQMQVLNNPSKPLDTSFSALVSQQKACEAEALRVFRLLTSQVFGRLLSSLPEEDRDETDSAEPAEGDKEGKEDEVRDHVVDILFSKGKLSNLQKQVCVHIIQSVNTETVRMKDEWETVSSSPPPPKPSRQTSIEAAVSEEEKSSDTYCYELLSMLTGLSQSEVGCSFLSEQEKLMQDLFTLLHVGSTRLQLQVCTLFQKVLPAIGPKNLAPMLNVRVLPPLGYSAIAEAVNSAGTVNQLGILDCLLAVISKALSVQVKAKGRSTNILQVLTGDSSISAIRLEKLVNPKPVPGETTVRTNRWYLKGSVSHEVAGEVIKLLKDMVKGSLGCQWEGYAKSAIGQAVLHLTKINEEARVPVPGMFSQTLWLCLGALCVIDEEHAEALSSGQWLGQDGKPKTKPLCDNHDDGESQALISCDKCGNLCGECDRVLHYSRTTKDHQRQIFKEEEEAVKVDLHEGCGRIKLYWTMALTDYRTLKGMVEFKEAGSGGGKGSCRFCGTTSNTGLLAIGNVCADPECQERADMVCDKTLPCGHPCSGVKGEENCLACLHGCATDNPKLKQDADDMCMVCYTEGLSCAACIQLECGHVFHYHCCRNTLTKRWSGPRITFRFMFCSICVNTPIAHPKLADVLDPIQDLYEDTQRKCRLRLEYENQMKCEALTSPTSKFYQKPVEYAMWKYAYYVCFKCKKAYYGGEAHCAEQVAASDDYDPSELVCPSCSNVGGALQVCPKHGTDFLEYKCRYCCTVAVYFCFGTTHFCNSCHDDFQRLTSMRKDELPQCPVGPLAKPLEGTECPLHVKHPPTGEEFALGCGVCRNAQTF